MQLEMDDLAAIEWLVKKLGSQDEAAHAIGVSERTLGRYRRQECSPVNKTALAGFRSALNKATRKAGRKP